MGNGEISLIIIIKFGTLILAAFCLFWGVRFFIRKNETSIGNLKGSFTGYHISVENATPGTILILSGAILCFFSIYKGVEVNSKVKRNNVGESGINTFKIDSSKLGSFKESINLDSIYSISDSSIKNDNYLNALKYLYFLNGAIYSRNDIQPSFRMKLDRDIDFCERRLKASLELRVVPSESEEIRSIKIENRSNDSIR